MLHVHPGFAPRALVFVLCLLASLAGPSATVSAGQQPAEGALSEAERYSVVGEIASLLADRYVFPDVGEQIADSLRLDLREGRFASVSEPAELADALSRRIRSIGGDGHLWVSVQPGQAGGAGEPPPETAEERRRRLARSNFGLPRAEILDGNVGYLDVRQFVDPELAAEALGRALAFLSNADALILDLRRSSGGSPEMVALVASALFEPDPPVHLFDVYHRPDDRTDEHWTEEAPGLHRFATEPVYVLTRGSTFSAGEALAHVLRHRGRATVVGERTAGGAHPGRLHPVGERFAIFVAEARAINPVTGGNWEGTGVEPHVATEGERALRKAHLLALESLRQQEGDPERADALRRLVEDLGTGGNCGRGGR